MKLERWISFSPILLLFGGFRYSIGVGFTPGLYDDDTSGGRTCTYVGWYWPADRKGIGIIIWPIQLWFVVGN